MKSLEETLPSIIPGTDKQMNGIEPRNKSEESDDGISLQGEVAYRINELPLRMGGKHPNLSCTPHTKINFRYINMHKIGV